MTIWSPDTDGCKVRMARGRFEVWFTDGRTDPAVVGFATLVEAEDFVAKDPRAVGRPHRVESTGVDAGEPLEFVKGKESKVHARVHDVMDENRTKNLIMAEVERIAPGATVKWRINPDDRMIEIEMEGATKQLKDRVKADMVDTKEIAGRSLNLKAKVRIV